MNLKTEPYGLKLCGILRYGTIIYYMVIDMVKILCKLTGLQVDKKDINQNGYSKEHFSEFQKMRNYAKKQLNQNFGINDYRKMMGFEVSNRNSLTDDQKTKVRVYFHER